MTKVRMLALCLVAVFAVSATTLVIASPALAAGCNTECKELKEKEKQEAKEKKEAEKKAAQEQKEKEKAEAKAKKAQEKAEKEAKKREEEAEEGKGEWARMSDCQLDNLELSGCIYGIAGSESFFTAGKVEVHFVHPVELHGGFIENEETGYITWYGARNGNTISKENEPGPPLNEDIDTALLATRCAEEPSVKSACHELARYEAYVAGGGSMATTVTIELAAPQPGGIFLNEANLLSEKGEAFGFPVMLHLNNKFVGKKCYVGTVAHPVEVPFTTGTTAPEPPNEPITGTLGKIKVIGGGQMLEIDGTTLVNNEYTAPGVHACGQNGQLDGAINSALELPSPAGHNTAILIGSLFQSGAEPAREHLETSGQ